MATYQDTADAESGGAYSVSVYHLPKDHQISADSPLGGRSAILYLARPFRHEVLRLELGPEGKEIPSLLLTRLPGAIGERDTQGNSVSPTLLNRPNSVVRVGSFVFVSDSGNNRILRWDERRAVWSIASRQDGRNVRQLATDGHVVVADTGSRVSGISVSDDWLYVVCEGREVDGFYSMGNV